MSMPPLARWEYDWHPEPGSPEARLYQEFLRPATFSPNSAACREAGSAAHRHHRRREDRPQLRPRRVASQQVRVAAIASRDAAKARAFARRVRDRESFGTYDALLADADIDAIYNPLPNGLHAAWSIRALWAGKHVLCEKPLSANAAEARAMFCRARNGVHLWKGFHICPSHRP